MAKLISVPITMIEHNPFRDIEKYPFIERKIEALMRSIGSVGLWEGIIARNIGADVYQLAFGHHRFEAAVRSGLDSIPVIVRDLSDEQMLQFMARENLEDYNSDFLSMLETWEAAYKFKGIEQPIDLALFLGWTQTRPGSDRGQMSRTAEACHAARRLVRDGHITREDLTDLTVAEAREILTRTAARMEQIDKVAKVANSTPEFVANSKTALTTGLKKTIEETRSGSVSQAELRARVDLHAHKALGSEKDTEKTPLFHLFAKDLTTQLYRILRTDTAAEKLEEIILAMRDIGADGDWSMVEAIRADLDGISDRALSFRERLVIPKGAKVVKQPPVRLLEEKRA